MVAMKRFLSIFFLFLSYAKDIVNQLSSSATNVSDLIHISLMKKRGRVHLPFHSRSSLLIPYS